MSEDMLIDTRPDWQYILHAYQSISNGWSYFDILPNRSQYYSEDYDLGGYDTAQIWFYSWEELFEE